MKKLHTVLICNLCNKPIHGALYASTNGFSHIACKDAEKFMKAVKKAKKKSQDGSNT